MSKRGAAMAGVLAGGYVLAIERVSVDFLHCIFLVKENMMRTGCEPARQLSALQHLSHFETLASLFKPSR
jgi:hypothetical protein